MRVPQPLRPVFANRPRTAALVLALLLDRYLGEPPERIHPVVWMGDAISALNPAVGDDRFRAARTTEVLRGAACLSAVAGGSALAGALATRTADRAGWPGLLLEAGLLKSCLAYRALDEAGEAVTEPLERGELVAARSALRVLVSRDRSALAEPLVAAAAIESLAENLSDSFTAPLLAYALGGLPAALFYRAVNTADAMIGYRGRYEYLGKPAARLDDLLNLLPARLTALALVVAAGRAAPRAGRAALRYSRLPASPNAGWPMAAAAGALGVSLRKPGHYRLNESAPAPAARDLRRARSLCRRAALLCAGVAVSLVALRNAATRPFSEGSS